MSKRGRFIRAALTLAWGGVAGCASVGTVPFGGEAEHPPLTAPVNQPVLPEVNQPAHAGRSPVDSVVGESAPDASSLEIDLT